MFSQQEKDKIYSFFGNNQILADCFIQLYDYQKISVNDIQLDFRDGLIGFKRDGERLRLYVTKGKNGIFRIKIKAATSHVFIPAEMINYQSDIDKNNILFSDNQQSIKVKDQNKNKVVKKQGDTVLPKVKRTASKRGVQRFIISNLSIDDIKPLLECISEFKRDGIKRVRVRIVEDD